MTNDLRRRREDQYPLRLWVLLRGVLAAAGLMAVFSFALTLTLMAGVLPSSGPLPDRIVLSAVLKPDIAETAGRPSLSHPVFKTSMTFREITGALAAGAKDARVKGLVVKIEDAHLNLAQIQELRDAVKAFRKSGKFAWIYGDSFGTFSPGMGDYYLAAAFGQVWMQPVGAVAITGIAAEMPFGKDFLDKIGVNPEFSHKGTYKSFPEMMTRNDMSDANREMMTALVGDLSRQVVAGIAGDRGMSPAALGAKIDAAPFADAEALKLHLVDRLGYYDELLDAAKKQAAVDDKGIVGLAAYRAGADGPALGLPFSGKKDKDAKKIALIYGVGDIVPYGGGAHTLGFGGGGMAADRTAAAFRAAREDKNVAAVVLRLDTPGGSPEAAETIRRAVIEMKRKGRPVIISMGGTAASGGYWVAAAGDKIVAEPATLTGSIGVFGGKMDLSGLWGKLGVSWDSVAAGKHARMWSSNRPFAPEEKARFETLLDGIYGAFIARVAEGRHLSKEKVEAVAEGRVWTGAQAKERGLVDALGGLERAVALAREAAKLGADAPVVEFPPRKSGLALLAGLFSSDDSALSLLPLDASAVLGAQASWTRGVLRMQPMEIR